MAAGTTILPEQDASEDLLADDRLKAAYLGG
jgi:hypothetical protein